MQRNPLIRLQDVLDPLTGLLSSIRFTLLSARTTLKACMISIGTNVVPCLPQLPSFLLGFYKCGGVEMAIHKFIGIIIFITLCYQQCYKDYTVHKLLSPLGHHLDGLLSKYLLLVSWNPNIYSCGQIILPSLPESTPNLN